MTSHVTRLKPDGQAARLLRWLRDHPASSSLEMTQALWIVNTTGAPINAMREAWQRVFGDDQ